MHPAPGWTLPRGVGKGLRVVRRPFLEPRQVLQGRHRPPRALCRVRQSTNSSRHDASGDGRALMSWPPARTGRTVGAARTCALPRRRGAGGRRPDEGWGHLRRDPLPLTPALSSHPMKGEGAKRPVAFPRDLTPKWDELWPGAATEPPGALPHPGPLPAGEGWGGGESTRSTAVQ